MIMALLFADSFEHYGTGATGNTNLVQGPGAYAEVTSTTYAWISTTRSRTGARSFERRASGGGANLRLLRRLLNTASNEVGVSVGVYQSTLGAASNLTGFGFFVGTTAIITVGFGATGSIVVRRGSLNTGTILGSTDDILSAAAFYHIEVRMLRDNVVGEVEIRVNGVPELVLENLDLGTSDADGFCFLSNFSGAQTFFDDLILWDTSGDVNNTFFGPARVNTVFMSADTDVDDWSVTGAATGAEAIDETTPDGDTTYVSAAIVGQRSEFVPGELPPETEVISGVYIPAMAKLASAGVGNFQLSIVSNGEVASGPDYPLTTAYTYWPSIFEKDPDGNKVWSKAAFEAARVRIEKTA